MRSDNEPIIPVQQRTERTSVRRNGSQIVIHKLIT